MSDAVGGAVMTPRVGIVADDFTSALEGAAAFAAAGLQATACLDAVESKADVVAVDADSRRRPSSVAHGRVFACAAELSARDVLVKTVDSTLRGHIRSEVALSVGAPRKRSPVSRVRSNARSARRYANGCASDLLATAHDSANRAALAKGASDDLDLAGVGMGAERKVVDRFVGKLRPHP